MKSGDLARVIRAPDQPAWLYEYEDRVCLVMSEVAWDGMERETNLREILIDGKKIIVHIRDLAPLKD